MSCPSCQLGGRRLPSLPLGYANKPRTLYKNLRNLELVNNGRQRYERVGSAKVRGNVPAQLEDSPMSMEDPEEIHDCLLENPDVVDDFVLKHVPQEVIERWLVSKSRTDNHIGETEDDSGTATQSLSKWKFCVHKDKRNVLDNLTRDIFCARSKADVVMDLAMHIADAIHADRYTFYLVDETVENHEAMKNDFMDIHTRKLRDFITKWNWHICYETALIPNGTSPKEKIESLTTISGFSARKQESVFVTEILGDDRFPTGTGQDGIDLSAICHPIKLASGRLYGVVEFVRAAKSGPFDEQDYEITCSYLSWGNIAVHYCEAALKIKSQARIGDFAYHVATQLLKKAPLDSITAYILTFALRATESTYYRLFGLDENTNELITIATNLKNEDGEEIEIRLAIDEGIPGHVFQTGETINIKEAYSCPYFSRETDAISGFTSRSIVAVPLSHRGSIVGVMQLINKKSGLFNEKDMDLLRLCATFCNIVIVFEQDCVESEHKDCEIDLLKEILQYHSKPKKKDLRDITHVVGTDLPDDFYSLSFDHYQHSGNFGNWFMMMARDMFKKASIGFCEKKLVRFTATVKNYYRDLPYHNWIHAFSVAHFMYLLLQKVENNIPPVEQLAMVIACISHDLDHRARNNAFYQQTRHALGHLYDKSLMENHHIYIVKYLLEDEDNDIFIGTTDEQHDKIFATMTGCILATDLLHSFDYRDRLKEQIASEQGFSWEVTDDRELATYVMMTICDLCGTCKPWDIHQRSSQKIFDEFYSQAEEEVSLGIQPIPMFCNKADLPINQEKDTSQNVDVKNQIGFITGIVKPCVTSMMPLIPELSEVQEVLNDCLTQWEALMQEEHELKDDLEERSISFAKYNKGRRRRSILVK